MDLHCGQCKTEEELALSAHSHVSYSWRTHLVRPAQQVREHLDPAAWAANEEMQLSQRMKFWFPGENRKSSQVNIDVEASGLLLSVPYGKVSVLLVIFIEVGAILTL